MSNQVIPAHGSPPAVVRWSGVQRPDKWGNYYVDVELTPEQAEPLIEEMKARAQKELDKAVSEATGRKKAELPSYRLQIPIKTDYDKEGNETGKYRLLAKLKAAWENKNKGTSGTNSVVVCNAEGELLPGVEPTWNSEVYVSVRSWPYVHDASEKYGVKMELVGVQVIELGEVGPAAPRPSDAESCGFTLKPFPTLAKPVGATTESDDDADY